MQYIQSLEAATVELQKQIVQKQITLELKKAQRKKRQLTAYGGQLIVGT